MIAVPHGSTILPVARLKAWLAVLGAHSLRAGFLTEAARSGAIRNAAVAHSRLVETLRLDNPAIAFAQPDLNLNH